jgi:outer membrane protein OmpA-like peptidoglycan-associated protein
LSFFGAEVEGAYLPGKAEGKRVHGWAARGHLVGQLPFWSITPFVVAGTGATGVAGSALGNDADLGFHYGGGLKAYLTDSVALRLDLRDNILGKRGVASGVGHNGEVLLGVSWTFGRPSKEPVVLPLPPKDSDMDGLVDPKDPCPYDPENLNGFEDDDGCPDTPPALPSPVQKFHGTIEGIEFETDSAVITPWSYHVLGLAAKTLSEYPSVSVEIIGHTDSTGSEIHNLELSLRRAESVRDYLVESGVARDRLTVTAAGESEPISTNDTYEGRARNRRIEFRVSQALDR